LTTQLYFPNEPANRRDGLFNKELVLQMSGVGQATVARFDFVIDLSM
jgi:hypothetical protein